MKSDSVRKSGCYDTNIALAVNAAIQANTEYCGALSAMNAGTKRTANTKLSKEEAVLNIVYDSVEAIKHHNYIVSLDDKFGVVDAKGNIIVQIKYSMIQSKSNVILAYLMIQDSITVEAFNSRGKSKDAKPADWWGWLHHGK